MSFKLVSKFEPTGDQPEAIKKLAAGVEQNQAYQTLLGVTGSGKTFTMAKVIEETQLPTLVIAHNKTLAAQLYQEFRDFFPENAVSYFVSYYDYYQPEAYLPASDTYIEKEATINDEIDKLRLGATASLMTRPDVIIVASVSCIYNLGSPAEYGRYLLELIEGEIISRESLILSLANLQYDRSEAELKRGTYRLRGDTIQVWPAYDDLALKITTLTDKITKISAIHPISGEEVTNRDPSVKAQSFIFETKLKRAVIYPAKHYVVNPELQGQAIEQIRQDLAAQVKKLESAGKVIEAYRINQRVNHDLEMIKEFGFVNGIENYSRYFDGRAPGEPPFTLLEYFKENARMFHDGKFLTFIDESHMTIPQIRGMYHGDQARKQTLVDYGFRLPSAIDNRPLQFDEFLARNKQMIFVSATPQNWEIIKSNQQIVEQLVRPTGLIDPEIEVRPTKHQIEDLVVEILKRQAKGQRTLVTTMTKKMAEALTEFLNDPEQMNQLIATANAKNSSANNQTPNTNHSLPKVAYLHSDVATLDRSNILDDLRAGVYDVLVGINLLREGLDLPEVTLVAILDADKEGFLRSTTSLIQTMGRAARHVDGQVILYADRITGSMRQAMDETKRRRDYQIAYNLKHNIFPQTISKPIRAKMIDQPAELAESSANSTSSIQAIRLGKSDQIDLAHFDPDAYTPQEKKQLVKKLRTRMRAAADEMDFELAAALRDAAAKLL